MLVIPLLLAAAGPDPSIRSQPLFEPEEDSPWKLTFRVSAGGEWDTNAKRSIKGTADSEVLSDGLIRLLVDTRVRFDPAPGHQLSAGYLLGAKRFFDQNTEDLLVQNLNLSSAHALTQWLFAALNATAKMSRIRSSIRNYDIVYGDGALIVEPIAPLDIEAHGGLAVFNFPFEGNYDYLGARVGGAVSYRPIRGLSFSGGFDWIWRNYKGNALVIGTAFDEDGIPINVLTFCTDEDRQKGIMCTSPGERRDTEAQVFFNTIYRGPFVVGGGYLFRRQRSNSDLEEVDRHRVSLFGTVGLPFDFTINVVAALQINAGTSITDTKFLAEDDENQNSVQAGIGYRITEELVAELRYALFANQFATNDVGFLRQTVYLGLGYRAGR
jgi:hypothetical protein